MSKDKYTWFQYTIGERLFPYMNSATLFRLMLLSSYAEAPMTKATIAFRLKLEKSTSCKFLKDSLHYGTMLLCKDKYYLADMFVSSGYRNQPSVNLPEYATRIYYESIQNLIGSSDPTSHKRLGYIFKLLPFVHPEYNIICYTPFEKNKDRIEPITIGDMCLILDLSNSQSHRSRMEDVLLGFKFMRRQDGKVEYVFRCIDTRDMGRVYILNPHIAYNGSNISSVQNMAKFDVPSDSRSQNP